MDWERSTSPHLGNGMMTSTCIFSGDEWAKACNMRQDYWLYAVYNCATPNPRLARVQDPFGNLLAKAKGSVLVSHAQVAEAETSL
jgi:hypothetical protein